MNKLFGGLFAPTWNPFQQFQRELNRVFDRWSEGQRWEAPAYPAVNVWEDGEHLWLEAELPGLDLQDLEIYVTGGNQLTLKGERKAQLPEKAVWHRQEQPAGEFVRVLTLPYPVDADKVEAKLENGVLQIRLAKQESARPRKIQVKAE